MSSAVKEGRFVEKGSSLEWESKGDVSVYEQQNEQGSSPITSSPFVIGPIAMADGGTTSADDVTIFAANAPFNMRILDVVGNIATGVDTESIQLRDATGGSGNVKSSSISCATADQGTVRQDVTAPYTLDKGDSLVIRRSHDGIIGSLHLIAVQI